MPVELKVRFNDGAKTKKVIAGLRHAASTEFVRSIPLENFAEWLQKRLAKESPAGGTGRSYWVRYIRAGGETDSPYADVQRPKFNQGWFVIQKITTGNVTFEADHELLHLGPKGRARYLATLRGSSRTQWTARYDFRFKIGPNRWVGVKKGKSQIHGASDGTPVEERVSSYVERFLLPRIGSRVTNLMLQKMT